MVTQLMPRETPAHQARLSTLPDIERVRKAREGNREAFLQLYDEHSAHVYATCLRMVGESGRAKELAQDTFVRAWRMLGAFRGESPFGAWIHRIAVNAVLDHLRSGKRLAERVEFTDDPPDGDSTAGDPAPETTMDLERLIAALPTQARMVLVLHDIEGHTHEEIGALMGIARGTSKAQLHRARQLLKEALSR